eukprot:4339874-Pleurochrysis_carterae.AAC.1
MGRQARGCLEDAVVGIAPPQCRQGRALLGRRDGGRVQLRLGPCGDGAAQRVQVAAVRFARVEVVEQQR